MAFFVCFFVFAKSSERVKHLMLTPLVLLWCGGEEGICGSLFHLKKDIKSYFVLLWVRAILVSYVPVQFLVFWVIFVASTVAGSSFQRIGGYLLFHLLITSGILSKHFDFNSNKLLLYWKERSKSLAL